VLTTALFPVPLAPEISLHLADAEVGLFDPAGGEFRSDEPPPFWAFVWAGGQALARYVLDHPETVRGRTVLDLAAGSDIDPAAAGAIRRNALVNRVEVSVADAADDYDVVLAGDAFYSGRVADGMSSVLREHARRGARILVGDPGRGFFPERLFTLLEEYPVPVPTALEETESLITGVYEMRATIVRGRPPEMFSSTN
jgi:predicted nicotinamide N-methyase